MKRVVSASVITLLIIVAVAATFFYLKNARNKGGDPVLAIPADAAFLIVYDPLSEKLSDLLDVNFWPVLKAAPIFATLIKQLTFFDTTFHKNSSAAEFLAGKPLFITGHVTGAGKFDFIFLKSLDNGYNEEATDNLIKSLSGSENETEKRNYDGNIIREISLENGKVFSFVTAKGIFIASYTPFLVEDALRQMKLGKPVITDKTLLAEINKPGKASMCINFKNLPLLSGVFLENVVTPGMNIAKSYGEWAIAVINPLQNKLQFNGFLTETSAQHFAECFDGQSGVDKKLIHILPRKTVVINYIGTNNFNSFYQKFNSYISTEQKNKKQQLLQSISAKYKLTIESKMLEWIGNEYALVITEPAGSNIENNSFAIFKAKNITQAKKTLTGISRVVDKKNSSATMEESYNGHGIGFIRLNGVIAALFGESFNKVSKMYYTDIDEYIVFANQASAIRTFIDEYRSGLLLYKTDFYQDANSSFPAKGNHFFFIRPPIATQILKSKANADWKKHIDKYKEIFSGVNSIGFQISAGDSLIKFNSVINFFKNEAAEGVDQIFAVDTDSTVSMKPLITTDPVNKSRQLVFQDDAANLYLTDNSGNIIWKQHIEGKIMSEIFEIDLFKNNTRQFLFNTEEYLYLLDTKGSPVGNYPIRLPAKATNGLSVYDFDKNKEFKIYIACDNRRIYAYQPSGKPLPGWNFQNTIDVVSDPVRSVVVNGKDILLINDQSGTILFVNRFGEKIIPVNQEISKAKYSGVYVSSTGHLITTDPSGNVIEVQQDGIIKTTALPKVSAGHGFLYADADADKIPDYIFLDRRELTAYNSELVLLFKKVFESNMIGEVQLLYLNNGEKVLGIRSVESDKFWLVKMNGTVYNGFPVKGSTMGVVDELNLDGKKHLITGGRENLLYVYSLE